MKVIIRTEWPDVVEKCLNSMELNEDSFEGAGSLLIVRYATDTMYREVAIWLGHALACGLILRGEIER